MCTTKFTHAPCPVCESTVHGRIDKRYCALKCKNAHHYASRRMNKPMTTIVNQQLLRNLTILEGIMQNKSNKLTMQQMVLIKLGFCFSTITGIKFEKGEKVYECYQYTFTLEKNGMVTILQIKQVSKIWPGFYERWSIDFPDLNFQKSIEGATPAVTNPISPG